MYHVRRLSNGSLLAAENGRFADYIVMDDCQISIPALESD